MSSARPDPRQSRQPAARPASQRPVDHHEGAPVRRGTQAARRGSGGRRPPDTSGRTQLLLGGVIVVGLLVAGMAVVTFLTGGATPSPSPTLPPVGVGGGSGAGAGAPGATAAPGATTRINVGAKPAGCPTAAPAALPAGETRTVTVQTRKGVIIMQIKADLSPLAAGNFVALAECGFYTGVVFHRLVPGFVIQGGDRQGTGRGDPGYTIKDEPVTTAYKRGTVAMARTSAPNSQGGQFFIVLNDKNVLAQTNTYAIFGTVISGMDVVDAIAAMPNSGSPNNSALDPVAMDTVAVTKP